MNVTYVTGNYGKYISVKNKAEKRNISLEYFKYDLEEPNINDIEIISKKKAEEAYKKISKPVIVTDSGFYIENYPNNPGYPGAFVKRSGVSTNIDDLLKILKDIENRNCYFMDCLTYFDGKEFTQFLGKHPGILTKEKKGENIKEAKSNLWYVFIPEGYKKTLAEMTDEERYNRKTDSVIDKFFNWYQNNIM